MASTDLSLNLGEPKRVGVVVDSPGAFGKTVSPAKPAHRLGKAGSASYVLFVLACGDSNVKT